MASFEDIISDLSNANTTAVAEIVSNRTFNSKLLNSLGVINDQIRDIADSIRRLNIKLSESERYIQRNQEVIERNQEELASIQERMTESQNANDQASEQLRMNEQEMEALRRDLATNQAERATEIEELNQRLQRETADLSAAKDVEKQQELQAQVEDTEARIAQLQQESQDASNALDQQLQELRTRHSELEAELATSREETNRARNEMEGLSRDTDEIRAQNVDLTEKLETAKRLMTEATNTLKSLSEEEDHTQINALIRQINDQIEGIRELLSPDDLEYVDASQGPGLDDDTEITQIYNENGRPTEKTFTLLALKNKVMNTQIKANIKAEILKKLNNAKNVEEIKEYLDNMNRFDQGRLTSILQDIRGGRKTRRRINRKGRKTKKIRKQRGGYHYSERSRRKRITTTARRRSTSRRSTSRRTASL